MRRRQRRHGRSAKELRAALAALQRQWEQETRRHRRTLDQLRRARLTFETEQMAAREMRRAEDVIRDEYHDSRARTVAPAASTSRRTVGKKKR